MSSTPARDRQRDARTDPDRRQPISADLVIGVSIPVADPWGSHLQDLRVRNGEPRARHITTHITLLPPTSVAPQDLDEVLDHIRAVARARRPFDVALEGTGTFRPLTPVVFARVSEGGRECELFQAELRSGPVRRELDYPYHPHVTLAHGLSDDALDRVQADLAGLSCRFPVDRINVHHHHGDEHWSPTGTLPLGG